MQSQKRNCPTHGIALPYLTDRYYKSLHLRSLMITSSDWYSPPLKLTHFLHCLFWVDLDLYSLPPCTHTSSTSEKLSSSTKDLLAGSILLELLVYKDTKLAFSHSLMLLESSWKEQNSWPFTRPKVVCHAAMPWAYGTQHVQDQGRSEVK